jgi:hypothetical protein
MSYLACIGQRYKDAGLPVIFVQFGFDGKWLSSWGYLWMVLNITTREFGHTSLQVKLSSEYDSWNFSFLSSQDLISELHSRFPTKAYRQISLIFIRKTTGFYRFRLFSFRVLQIPAFLIPGFTDFGFSHSRYNRFRLSSFRVLQILESLHGKWFWQVGHNGKTRANFFPRDV